jgi:hypothetical protein
MRWCLQRDHGFDVRAVRLAHVPTFDDIPGSIAAQLPFQPHALGLSFNQRVCSFELLLATRREKATPATQSSHEQGSTWLQLSHHIRRCTVTSRLRTGRHKDLMSMSRAHTSSRSKPCNQLLIAMQYCQLWPRRCNQPVASGNCLACQARIGLTLSEFLPK